MSKLFTPVKVGPNELQHRVVLAPADAHAGRCRKYSHRPDGRYYTQRASQGGLLIAEATAVSPLGIAYVDGLGIFTEAQAAGWSA